MGCCRDSRGLVRGMPCWGEVWRCMDSLVGRPDPTRDFGGWVGGALAAAAAEAAFRCSSTAYRRVGPSEWGFWCQM